MIFVVFWVSVVLTGFGGGGFLTGDGGGGFLTGDGWMVLGGWWDLCFGGGGALASSVSQ